MTDDITHGLALLADEAEPAHIDSYAVISKARARTRNRRGVAAAFLAVAAIGAFTVTTAAEHQTSGAAAPPESPAQRLNAQLDAVLPELIPSRWQARPAPPSHSIYEPPHVFSCRKEVLAGAAIRLGLPKHTSSGWELDDSDNCSAHNWYQDAEGELELAIGVNNSGKWYTDPCMLPDCEEQELPDGTVWRVGPNAGASTSETSGIQSLQGLRPDGTYVSVTVLWQEPRSTPPMTVDEMVKFMDKFSY